MKKYYTLFLLTVIIGLSACIKEQADPFEAAKIQLGKDEEIIKKFIADNNIPAVRHESGLYYQIIKSGSGNHVYSGNSSLSVNYLGKLLSGNVFDSTEPNKQFKFVLGDRIIDGWKIGVPLIQKGGKIRLLIPSGYAYGTQDKKDNQGRVTIPANSILDFEIEIIDVQ